MQGTFYHGYEARGLCRQDNFDFKTVIPCHYRTMPLLEQSADVLATALLNVDVIEPQVMVPIVFA